MEREGGRGRERDGERWRETGRDGGRGLRENIIDVAEGAEWSKAGYYVAPVAVTRCLISPRLY